MSTWKGRIALAVVALSVVTVTFCLLVSASRCGVVQVLADGEHGSGVSV
jgi:hypothetical protein